MEDQQRQSLNFWNMMMQMDMDMTIATTIISHNRHHPGQEMQMQTSHSLEGGDQEFNGATGATERKTQKLNNLGQEVKMQTLCREEEDGEDLDTDGRQEDLDSQLGIGLDLYEVQEEVPTRTSCKEENLEELQMPT